SQGGWWTRLALPTASRGLNPAPPARRVSSTRSPSKQVLALCVVDRLRNPVVAGNKVESVRALRWRTMNGSRRAWRGVRPRGRGACGEGVLSLHRESIEQEIAENEPLR